VVEPESLLHLVSRCDADKSIGICGSRLIYSETPDKLQGLGGIYSPLFCRTTIFAALEDSKKLFDDNEVENSIDYVIGASMLLRRELLTTVGLLDEGYFLYFEELDLAFRARPHFKISCASKSIVYHKEGASTKSSSNPVSDFLSIRNRLRFTLLNNKIFLPTVWAGIFGSLFNRIKNREFEKSLNILRIILLLPPPPKTKKLLSMPLTSGKSTSFQKPEH